MIGRKVVHFENEIDGMRYAVTFKVNIWGQVSQFKMCRREKVHVDKYLHYANNIVPIKILCYSNRSKIVQLINQIALTLQKLMQLWRNRLLHR